MDDRDEVVLDRQYRIIVDLVSTTPMYEYRASIYDLDSELLTEGWSDSVRSAIADAWQNYDESE